MIRVCVATAMGLPWMLGASSASMASVRARRPDRIPVREPIPLRPAIWDELYPRLGKRHQLELRSTVNRDSGGLELGYRIRWGQRWSSSASFEYLWPDSNALRIISTAQTLQSSFWIRRSFSGPHASLSVTYARNWLFQVRDVAQSAIVPGVAVGWQVWLPGHLSLALRSGLRRPYRVDSAYYLCTLNQCPYLDEELIFRLEFGFGYIF